MLEDISLDRGWITVGYTDIYIYIQVWIFLNKYRPLANHNLIFVILRDRKLRKDSNLMICCEKHAWSNLWVLPKWNSLDSNPPASTVVIWDLFNYPLAMKHCNGKSNLNGAFFRWKHHHFHAFSNHVIMTRGEFSSQLSKSSHFPSSSQGQWHPRHRHARHVHRRHLPRPTLHALRRQWRRLRRSQISKESGRNLDEIPWCVISRRHFKGNTTGRFLIKRAISLPVWGPCTILWPPEFPPMKKSIHEKIQLNTQH